MANDAVNFLFFKSSDQESEKKIKREFEFPVIALRIKGLDFFARQPGKGKDHPAFQAFDQIKNTFAYVIFWPAEQRDISSSANGTVA